MGPGRYLPQFAMCMYLFFHLSTTIVLNANIYLQHADNAQQAFSSDSILTLHLAIPALEALHRAWSIQADRPNFLPFVPAPHAACVKIDSYYEKTTDSPAYIMSMSMNTCFD